ncbi:MAG: MerR family DNA-binding transcriptional regulator [Caulobacterales bacterium]|nr:MerR family DNA-binding transcriptional regulator [Caulobacterales bacterium]
MMQDDGPTYSIGELAESFGVTARALRFYETKGLLRPLRLNGGARVYSANDRARLALVLRGKRVGFSLDEIKEMIDLSDIGADGRASMTAARDRFAARIQALQRQREDLDLALADLEAGLAWLEARIEGAEPSEDLKRRAAAFEALAQSWLYGEAVGSAAK